MGVARCIDLEPAVWTPTDRVVGGAMSASVGVVSDQKGMNRIVTLIISFLWSWAVIWSGGGQMARSWWHLQQLLSQSDGPLRCHSTLSCGNVFDDLVEFISFLTHISLCEETVDNICKCTAAFTRDVSTYPALLSSGLRWHLKKPSPILDHIPQHPPI